MLQWASEFEGLVRMFQNPEHYMTRYTNRRTEEMIAAKSFVNGLSYSGISRWQNQAPAQQWRLGFGFLVSVQ
jgi:hypothetical protein